MKEELFIGRKEEQAILKETLTSREAEMVAVIGRRRIGKTYLINRAYEEQIIFQVTGIQHGTEERQLVNFYNRLQIFGGEAVTDFEQPEDWFSAFFLLEKYLRTQLETAETRKVIFIDEVPWIASPSREFLSALGLFWNNWAHRQNLVVVICGSAASWMIQKVVNHTGGLHNRITRYIHLKPFTLAETEEYLRSQHFTFTRYQMVELYMALGGVPHYLKEIRDGRSATQNIDRICFSPTGLLENEFSRLYPALFENADYHIEIIKALATKRMGMTRAEIIAKANVPNGGATSRVLEELEQSDFITGYYPFGKKKKDRIYRLTDEYSLFYLHFMQDKTNEGEGTWQYLSQTQTYKTWSGYAYESICLKHVPQIKKALGISGVYTKPASFFKKGTAEEKGAQIDLLLDRNDKTINLIEVKFYDDKFTVTKAYAEQLRQKRTIFKETSKTRKSVLLTFITTFGLNSNKHSLGLIQNDLSLDDLFA